MFSAAQDDDMVECPYNKYHQMLRKRLIPHLIKCRLSYPDAELIKCPFNASHLIPEPEFTHHVANCKDKAIIHQYKYNTLPVKIDEADRQQVEIDCDENWDDTEAVDYDPKKYVSQANVIRTHIGDLPSVRKEFRKSERKRLGDEDSSDDDEALKTFGKRIYKDMDSKEKEEIKEKNWFEDRGASSSSKSGSQRKDSFQESLKEFAKERSRDEDSQKTIIKKESNDSDEDDSKRRRRDDSPEKSRRVDESRRRRSDDSPKRSRREEDSRWNRRDDSPKRSHREDDFRTRRRDDYPERRHRQDDSRKRRCEEYPLDDDPYYRSRSSNKPRFVGMSRGARRGHDYRK
ncbi:nuclear speckle splicing regulatory protein 1-like [Episyrphus balteatus]|uniref:nuclear speckle splicing regulatory protein 1-like n=1 Tax=Episyrphus balteatus TaxID=286459 RepID=UPI002486A114|nr:nuclear speckle splicing regulatory protein 1-like [Episyrphus balteatus]